MHAADPNPLTNLFAQHRQALSNSSLIELFAQDAARAQTFSIEAAGLLLDFSKNFCTEQTLQLFERQAAALELHRHIDELFQGAIVNNTEQRPVLHTSLRAQTPTAPMYAQVQTALAQMQRLTIALSRGEHKGFTDRPI